MASELAISSKGLTLTPENGIEVYLQAIQRIPILSADEEKALAVRLHQDGDLVAARKLVISHLRFVVHIARGYQGYGLPLGDLIQEGNIGLMKAVKRFNPEVGVRLISFAVHWIRAEIHEFILRNWRIVKVATTKAQRKLFFNLRQSKKRLGWLNKEEIEHVAEDLGVSTGDVMEMESRLSGQDLAFDAQPERDDDDGNFAPAGYLEAPSEADPAVVLEGANTIENNHEWLEEAMHNLDPRSRDILSRRWLKEPKATLQELADEYKISAERIRQVENNAIKKLRAQLATA